MPVIIFDKDFSSFLQFFALHQLVLSVEVHIFMPVRGKSIIIIHIRVQAKMEGSVLFHPVFTS